MTNRFADLRGRIPETQVVCHGHSALDQIWAVEDGFTDGSQKIRAGGHATAGGGMTATDFVATAAALKCARPGGRAGIPSLDETLALLGSANFLETTA